MSATRADIVRAVLDRQLALDLELAAILHTHGCGAEVDLGVVRAVEEVGRLQVTREVLVFDDDRVDRDCPLEARLAVLTDREGAVVVLETAAEVRDDHVLDGKADMRVDLVDAPGPGGDVLLGCNAHWKLLSLWGGGLQSV
jgi:hypothetical protein